MNKGITIKQDGKYFVVSDAQYCIVALDIEDGLATLMRARNGEISTNE